MVITSKNKGAMFQNAVQQEKKVNEADLFLE